MTTGDIASKRVLAIDASRMAVDRCGIENYLHQLLPHLALAWSSSAVGGRAVRVFGSHLDVVAHVQPPLQVTPGGRTGLDAAAPCAGVEEGRSLCLLQSDSDSSLDRRHALPGGGHGP